MVGRGGEGGVEVEGEAAGSGHMARLWVATQHGLKIIILLQFPMLTNACGECH